MLGPPAQLPRKATRRELSRLLGKLPRGLSAYKIPEGQRLDKPLKEYARDLAIGDLNDGGLWYYEESGELNKAGESLLVIRRYQWDPFADVV